MKPESETAEACSTNGRDRISNSENYIMQAERLIDLESDNIKVDRKLDMQLWAGYMWLRIRISCGFL
jgi:hypothetical protein